ncbi:unnamed protein product [Prorocentrum cordatum]|uniref:C3H1-type domain-containing protein n=1 Tax=Prorocentrum cordatum TaxID=2364126 RepID=A0ABN9VVF8_9DINO|nr:unnamed protein product [Polarella glacialis]
MTAAADAAEPQVVSWPPPGLRAAGPAHCWECGKVSEGGWRAPNGQHYCSGCWEHWHSLPEDVPVPSWPSASRPQGGWKRKKATFCRLVPGRQSCSCCEPDDPTGLTWTGYEDSWFFSAEELRELRGAKYCDAHAHLDIILQNKKHGGLGWDTKQKLCKWFLASGRCPFHSYCSFAHGREELRGRQPLDRGDVESCLRAFAAGRREGGKDGGVDDGEGSEGPVLRCVVTNCCEVLGIPDTRLILELAAAQGLDTVRATFGCHPHDYRDYSDEMEARFLAENYYESQDPKERQLMLDGFSRQARIAASRRLPLIVHTRDAEGDTMDVLRACLPREHKIHIHAYQGNSDMMKQALEWFPNCVFGASSMLLSTYPSEGCQATARDCPLERLVLETDAPYLANWSHDVPKIAKKVAEMKGLTTLQVLEATTANCLRFYGVSQSDGAA